MNARTFLSLALLTATFVSADNWTTSVTGKIYSGSTTNIGIGTSTPITKLFLYTNTNIESALALDCQGTQNAQQCNINLITKGNGSTNLGNSATYGWHIAARGNSYTGSSERNDLGFYYWNGANWQPPVLWLENNGNIGIGTSSPGTYKLAVEGKIGAREVVVTNAAWADYVFKKDYKLKPLREVESFINTHGHLPEIPTEKQVKKEGVAIGEMQSKLLAKVEELTLYVIDQQKQMERQYGLMEKQNEQIAKMQKYIDELEAAKKQR